MRIRDWSSDVCSSDLDAAEEGDLLAREAFGSVGDWLGVGLANLTAAFDPEILVVGGGVSAAGDRLLEPARNSLMRSLVGAGHRLVPPVVAARFGPAAGLVGAADLVRQRVPSPARGARPDLVWAISLLRRGVKRESQCALISTRAGGDR